MFGIDPKTIRRGMEELEQQEDTTQGRVRKKGADVVRDVKMPRIRA